MLNSMHYIYSVGPIPIVLMSSASKVLLFIINERLKKNVADEIPQEQVGFAKGT